MVVLANGADHFVGRDALLLPPAQVGDAELFAEHVDFHVNAVGGGFDAVSDEEFAEIFVVHFGSAFGLAEGEAVVVYWEERFLGGHFVYFELDSGGYWRELRVMSIVDVQLEMRSIVSIIIIEF